MTEEEERLAKLWQFVDRLHNATSTGRKDTPDNPEEILADVVNILEEYTTAN